MITKIVIENFKSIGDRQVFELSDITLLYGPNSAGKSSIIQALRYAYEVLVNNDPDPVYSNMDSDRVYLGGFRNLVHQRDLSKKIVVGITIQCLDHGRYGDYREFKRHAKNIVSFLPNTKAFFDWMIDRVGPEDEIEDFFVPEMFQLGFLPITREPKSLSLTFAVKWNSDIQKVELDSIYVAINETTVWTQSGDATMFNSRSLALIPEYDYPFLQVQDAEYLLFSFYLQQAMTEDPDLIARIDPASEPEIFAQAEIHEIDEAKWYCEADKIFPGVAELINGKCIPTKGTWEVLKNWKIGSQDAEKRQFTHFSSWREAATPMFDHLKDSSWCFSWIGEPLRSSWSGDDGLSVHTHITSVLRSDVGGSNDDAIWAEQTVCFDHALDYLATLAVVVCGNVIDCLKSLLHIGPLREHRANVRVSESSSKGWYTGRAAWRTLEDKQVDTEAVTQWLMSQELFDTGYSIQRTKQKTIDNLDEFLKEIQVDPNSLTSLLERAATNTRIFVIDRYGLKLNSDEVGTGISQLIPILVAALYGSSICFIEQPELHLHPRCQLVIGDLLIHGLGSNRQLIVETHSEHLALRLLRRVRETSDNSQIDEKLKLKPDQLSVLYVQPTDSGSKIMRLRVDESGEFIDRWPKGFFDERAEELF